MPQTPRPPHQPTPSLPALRRLRERWRAFSTAWCASLLTGAMLLLLAIRVVLGQQFDLVPYLLGEKGDFKAIESRIVFAAAITVGVLLGLSVYHAIRKLLGRGTTATFQGFPQNSEHCFARMIPPIQQHQNSSSSAAHDHNA